MDFKFDKYVPWDSPDSGHNPLKFFRKWSVAIVTWPPKFVGVKC